MVPQGVEVDDITGAPEPANRGAGRFKWVFRRERSRNSKRMAARRVGSLPKETECEGPLRKTGTTFWRSRQ